MKTISKIIAAALVTATCLVACKKEKTSNNGDSYTSVQSFFSQTKVQTQSFTVNATNGGTITGAKGTTVTFPPNAFITFNGTSVTGNVTVQLKEVFSKKDMIYEGVFPVAKGGHLLNSAGEYFLAANQNGTPLQLKDGKFFEMRLPAQAADPNMQFFILDGAGDSAQWVVPDTAAAVIDSQWVVSPVNGFNFTTVPDSAYVINCDSLSWGNADVFMYPTYVDCSFKVTGGTISSANTKAYCVYDGKNTVWPCGDWFGGITNNTISDNHIAAIPIHFLLISVIDGQLYAGSTAVTPTNGGMYNVTIAPITKAELDALILSFN